MKHVGYSWHCKLEHDAILYAYNRDLGTKTLRSSPNNKAAHSIPRLRLNSYLLSQEIYSVLPPLRPPLPSAITLLLGV